MNRKKFISMTTTLMKQTQRLNAKRLKYGISSLENEVEDLDDEDFRQGLRMIIDGVEAAIIDEIFSNKIAFAKDTYARQYKAVLKRAVLGIQTGLNSYILYNVLTSYAGLTSKEMRELDYLLIRDTDEPDSEEEDTASTVAAYQFNSKRLWATAIEDIETELGENPAGVEFGAVSNPEITIKDNCTHIDKVTQIITANGGKNKQGE
jgi:flagellar motor component MotA